MARPRRNTLFLYPTRKGVEDDCQKRHRWKEGGNSNIQTREEIGFRESGLNVAVSNQTFIRVIRKQRSPSDAREYLVKSEGTNRMWKSKTALAPCLICICIISKCKVLLRCTKCSVTFNDDIDNAGLIPRENSYNLFRTSQVAMRTSRGRRQYGGSVLGL